MHLFVIGKDKIINMSFENQKELTRETINPEL